MTGRFIAIVGPSGVGKDSVMEGMAARDPRLALTRRVITRPSTAGGERFEGVSVQQFKTRRDAGQFALWWPAHGLLYGVPTSVDAVLAAGKDVLANLSRTMLQPAMTRFAQCEIIALTTSRDVLETRLRARGREDEADIAGRLDRSGYALPDATPAHVVDNSGALDQTVSQALDLLYPVRALP
ncbi:MAG: ribose 1,5-bisphosphokinase [Paracoccaceae bacterium]|jgi:ribose 1,5-bisphosphokinase